MSEKVIFRVVKSTGEIIAFFPDKLTDDSGENFKSYMHTYHFGSVTTDFIANKTEPPYPLYGGKFNPIYGELYMEIEHNGIDVDYIPIFSEEDYFFSHKKENTDKILSLVDFSKSQTKKMREFHAASACIKGALPGLSVSIKTDTSTLVLFELEDMCIQSISDETAKDSFCIIQIKKDKKKKLETGFDDVMTAIKHAAEKKGLNKYPAIQEFDFDRYIEENIIVAQIVKGII